MRTQEVPRCKLCPEVCCKNITAPLSVDEAIFLTEKGTRLTDVTPDHILRAYQIAEEFDSEVIVFDRTGTLNTVNGEHLYRMVGDCGNLLPPDKDGWRKCAAMHDPRRPAVCGSLVEGGSQCVKMRKARGIS